MGFNGLFFLAPLSMLLLLFNFGTAQTYIYHFCQGANYPANSMFQSNLNLLLTSVSNNTTPTRFYNISIGKEPDSTVNGLFQCRGDYSPEDCRRCATVAAEEITDRCPYNKHSVIFYDECMLHYSDRSFVSNVQFEPTLYMWNNNHVELGDLKRFGRTRTELLDRLVDQAVSVSSNLFAIGEENLTSSQKIYGLVQCTEDLRRSDCDRCVRRALAEIPRCCDAYVGGRVVKPSCKVRFETYDFFQTGIKLPSVLELNVISN